MTEWCGDLDDDCSLVRYGMIAHAEELNRGRWYFSIGPHPWVPGVEFYNTANNMTHVRLTNGKMARAAAECCLELLRRPPEGIGAGPDVPDGYWEKLAALIKRTPQLPDDDKSGDPPPLI